MLVMNVHGSTNDMAARIETIDLPAHVQPTSSVAAIPTQDIEPSADRAEAAADDTETTALAAALKLLRSNGFVVPTLAEVQTITAFNSGQAVETDTAEEPEFVTWRGSRDSSTYCASDADRFEEAERTREGYIHHAAEHALSVAANVREVIATHLRFPPRLADAYCGTFTLWVLHTYTYRVQRVTPYLLITSPTSGAGKSVAMEVLASMARRAEMMVNPTAAVVRTVASSDHTVMIDEVDELAKTRDFTSLANAGYRKGGQSYRIINGELTRFGVYSPKAFAGIAREELPIRGATLDRCIQISIERVAQEMAPQPFDAEFLGSTLAGIRERLEGWSEYAADRLRSVSPTIPELPTPRAAEIWRPLAAIADLLGGEWAASVRGWATAIEGQKDTAPDPNVRLLQDVHEVLAAWMQDNPHARVIAVEELVSLRNGLPERRLTEQLSSVQFGKRLGRFGIKSQPVKGVRVYRVRDAGDVLVADWADLFARYC
jgi:hypothetical protein